MKNKVLKILTIISIAIIILGILIGGSVKNEFKDLNVATGEVYIDGTNVTPIADAFMEIGSGLLSIIITGCILLIVPCIWTVYGIVILIIKLVRKCKSKNM